MRRAFIVSVVCLALGAAAAPALAQWVPPTPPSHRPAATLLLPYFEVGFTNSSANTVFSLNNASATAALVNVTLWSDLGVPVFRFNVYLTGYDVQWINLRDVIIGKLPQTATDGQDPADTISPQGDLSQDINFASCTGAMPPAPMDAATKAHVKAWLTGRMSPVTGNCAGLRMGGTVARGYVTIDTTSQCSQLTPADPGYFNADGTGVAIDVNVLSGDYYLIGGTRKADFSEPLVHLLANRNDPETSTDGQYTFYGRFVNWSGADHREPLATRFMARFFNGAKMPFAPNETEFLVWRDPKVSTAEPLGCEELPAWWPMPDQELVAFDEQEQASDITATTFPSLTRRVAASDLPLPLSGQLFLDLNATVAAAGAVPPEDSAAAQAWVTIFHRRTTLPAKYAVGSSAVPLDSAKKVLHTNIWWE